jgi:hypothetical protein
MIQKQKLGVIMVELILTLLLIDFVIGLYQGLFI